MPSERIHISVENLIESLGKTRLLKDPKRIGRRLRSEVAARIVFCFSLQTRQRLPPLNGLYKVTPKPEIQALRSVHNALRRPA